MFNTVKVRQGAIVVHVDGDASVKYQVHIAIPKDFTLELVDKPVPYKVMVINKKSFIVSDLTVNHKAVVSLKLSIQFQVQQHKNFIGELRMERLLENFKSLK